MQVPAEIAFQNCEPSEALRAEIARQVERLERFSDRITSCRVVVIGPETRHRHGDVYRIQLRIAMPGHKDIIVDKMRGDEPENEHLLVAVRNAFTLAQRQIEDAERKMRGDVKTHAPESHGKVARFIAGEDYGFIETPDGREVYFHRNAVVGGGYDRLAVGSEVRFFEEEGEKGAQASTVHVLGKHHST